ncbi:MAG: porin family protein [Bacteroidota bacterium]
MNCSPDNRGWSPCWWLLLVFLLVPPALHGQARTFSIGLMATGDIYGKSFDERSGATPTLARTFTASNNLSAGLNGLYNLSEHWTIRMGVLYASKSSRAFHNTGSGPISLDPDLPEATRVKLQYLDLPVNVLRHLLIQERFTLFASAGLMPGILIRDREQTTFQDGAEHNSSFLEGSANAFVLGITMSGGLNYRLNQAFSVIAEPFIRYYGQDIHEQLTASSQFSYGIGLGFFYHFGQGASEAPSQ